MCDGHDAYREWKSSKTHLALQSLGDEVAPRPRGDDVKLAEDPSVLQKKIDEIVGDKNKDSIIVVNGFRYEVPEASVTVIKQARGKDSAGVDIEELKNAYFEILDRLVDHYLTLHSLIPELHRVSSCRGACGEKDACSEDCKRLKRAIEIQNGIEKTSECVEQAILELDQGTPKSPYMWAVTSPVVG